MSETMHTWFCCKTCEDGYSLAETQAKVKTDEAGRRVRVRARLSSVRVSGVALACVRGEVL
jgi:hypothetical protein